MPHLRLSERRAEKMIFFKLKRLTVQGSCPSSEFSIDGENFTSFAERLISFSSSIDEFNDALFSARRGKTNNKRDRFDFLSFSQFFVIQRHQSFKFLTSSLLSSKDLLLNRKFDKHFEFF